MAAAVDSMLDELGSQVTLTLTPLTLTKCIVSS